MDELINLEPEDDLEFGGSGSKYTSGHATSGAITITSHPTCGKRLMISNEAWRLLDCPEFFYFHFRKPNQLIITAGTKADGTKVSFTPSMSLKDAINSKYSKKVIAYNGKLASYLWNSWNLANFSENKCCASVGSIKKAAYGSEPAVLVTFDEYTADVKSETSE